MKTLGLAVLACSLVLTLAGAASAEPVAPTMAPSESAVFKANPNFAAEVDLSPLRSMAVQHQQTIKTFDSYARQTLELITGHGSWDGQDPVYTVMDIACRPQRYVGLDMIKIRNVPLRTEFRRMTFLSSDQAENIVKTGMVSLDLLARPEVQNQLAAAAAADVRKATAVSQVFMARQVMADLCSANLDGVGLFGPAAIVPPAGGDRGRRSGRPAVRRGLGRPGHGRASPAGRTTRCQRCCRGTR